MSFEDNLEFAQAQDREDSLRSFRNEFIFPKNPMGKNFVYLSGNSLGLMPKQAKVFVESELEAWENHAVDAHLKGEHPWYSYHETVTEGLAAIVGARPTEVVAMNALSVNLHLMLTSFFQPKDNRRCIVMEPEPFSSDLYAVHSQLKWHGLNPETDCVLLKPSSGQSTITPDDLMSQLSAMEPKINLILLGNVNFASGQCFDVPSIVRWAHERGIIVGLDLAHGIGNIPLQLHDWGVDFAVWCSYKYLNSGPGGIAGVFVHESHAREFDRPRLGGWWGHDKHLRFQFGKTFQPMSGAEGWQVSNPAILPLACLRASLALYAKAGMPALVAKSRKLTGYLEFLIAQKKALKSWNLITPKDPIHRGAQLSYRVGTEGQDWVETAKALGVICDFRKPDIIRMAPAPLYNSFEDVYRTAQVFEQVMG